MKPYMLALLTVVVLCAGNQAALFGDISDFFQSAGAKIENAAKNFGQNLGNYLKERGRIIASDTGQNVLDKIKNPGVGKRSISDIRDKIEEFVNSTGHFVEEKTELFLRLFQDAVHRLCTIADSVILLSLMKEPLDNVLQRITQVVVTNGQQVERFLSNVAEEANGFLDNILSRRKRSIDVDDIGRMLEAFLRPHVEVLKQAVDELGETLKHEAVTLWNQTQSSADIVSDSMVQTIERIKDEFQETIQEGEAIYNVIKDAN